jgi:hypothetical protein
VGARVLARYHAGAEWWPGRVARLVTVSRSSRTVGGGVGPGRGGGSTVDAWFDVSYDAAGESERALPANFLRADPDAVALQPGTRVLVRYRGRPQGFAAVIEGLSPHQPWIRVPPAPTAKDLQVAPSRPATSAAATGASSSSAALAAAAATAATAGGRAWEEELSPGGGRGSIGGGGGGSRGGGSRGGSLGGGGSRGGGGSASVRSVGAQSETHFGLSRGRVCLAAEYGETDDHRPHHVVAAGGGGGTAEDALFDEAQHPGHGLGEADYFVYDVRYVRFSVAAFFLLLLVPRLWRLASLCPKARTLWLWCWVDYRYTHTSPDFTTKRELSVPRFLIKRDTLAQEVKATEG